MTRLAFSSDYEWVVSSSPDATVIRDFETEEILKVIEGVGDAQAIAEGIERFPFRALARGMEVVIENARARKAAAWFPSELTEIATHPSGRRWSGVVGKPGYSGAGNDLYLIQLEGNV